MQRNLSGWGVTITGLLLAGGGAYAMWTGWDMILVERGWSLFIAGAAALSGGVVTMALGRVIAHLARLAALSSEKIEATAPPTAAATPDWALAAGPIERPAADENPAAVKVSASQAAGKAAPGQAPVASAAAPKASPAQSLPLKSEGKAAKGEGPPHRPAAVPPRLRREAQTDTPAFDSRPAAPPDFAALLNGQPQPEAEPEKPPAEVDRYTAGDATYVMMSDGSVEVHSAEGVQRYPSLAALKAETALRQR